MGCGPPTHPRSTHRYDCCVRTQLRLTWAILVTAASTLDPAAGFLTMASFGLEKLPLLLLTGVSATFINVRAGLPGERAAGVLVMMMGAFLLARGIGIVCGIAGRCG